MHILQKITVFVRVFGLKRANPDGYKTLYHTFKVGLTSYTVQLDLKVYRKPLLAKNNSVYATTRTVDGCQSQCGC